jgi:hypothetical protein
VGDGLADGEPDADAEGDVEAEGVFDTDADGDVEADGVFEADAEGDVDGLLDAEAEAMTVPRFPSRASQRNTPALTVTEMRLRKSLASAKVACVSPATLKPPVAVTTMSPPPSVLIRRTSRIPGLVGLGSVRVSPEAPLTISQIWRSIFGRMIPALPGSLRIFGPLYRSW